MQSSMTSGNQCKADNAEKMGLIKNNDLYGQINVTSSVEFLLRTREPLASRHTNIYLQLL